MPELEFKSLDLESCEIELLLRALDYYLDAMCFEADCDDSVRNGAMLEAINSLNLIETIHLQLGL